MDLILKLKGNHCIGNRNTPILRVSYKNLHSKQQKVTPKIVGSKRVQRQPSTSAGRISILRP